MYSVFVSGSVRATTLPEKVQNELKRYMEKCYHINVGDAPGIDSLVQDYLKMNNYLDVFVYTSYDTPRYLAGPEWIIKKVATGTYEPGTVGFNRMKDIAMTDDSDAGLAVIKKGHSNATKCNIKRLLDQNKLVTIYQIA